MKSSQRQLYAERMDRVVHHIERRISDDFAPGLGELAAVAAMSEFHFHRVFRLMTGETPGEAIRRIRLAHTLPELASQAPVARTAGASGYATPQGFARALRAQAGMTATEARSSGVVLDALTADLLRPKREGAAPAPAIGIEVVSLEPLRLLAVRNVGDYAELNGGYRRLFELVLAQVPSDGLLGIYGVPHDDPRFTPADECRFDCALATSEAGIGHGDLVELRIGSGEYAKFRHIGEYGRLHDTIDLAYAGVIALLDRQVADAPMFIHYLDDPEEAPAAELRSDIYLPVT